MRFLTFAIASLCTMPLMAATRYTIVQETTGNRLGTPRSSTTVLVDGAHRRIEIAQKTTPYVCDVLLSDDGGATFIALNTELKTWFPLEQTRTSGPLHVFASPLFGGMSLRDVLVTASDEPSEPIDGYAAEKHVVKLSFTTRQKTPAGPLDAYAGETILIWTTEAVDVALAVPLVGFTTGLPEVDAQLAPALAKISGFPLKTVVAATHAYKGGPPQTTTVTATVSDLRTVAAAPHAFERPAGYVQQPPIIGAPGR